MKNYNKFFDKKNEEVKTEVEEITAEPLLAKIANCEKVYVREFASKESDPKTVLAKDEDIFVEEFDEDWYKVTTSHDIEGFVMKDFVEIDED